MKEGISIQKVTAIDQISDGAAVLIKGRLTDGKVQLFNIDRIKISESDGIEVILKKKGNVYFNFGMYLAGKSNVSEIYTVGWAMKDIRQKIRVIVYGPVFEGKKEVIKPIAEESFKAGKKHEYLCHFGSISRENESNLENWIKEKFGITSNKQ